MNLRKYSVIIIIAILLISTTAITHAEDPVGVIINGESIDFDVMPTIINGRVVVPIRAIFEELGLTVGWNKETQTAIGKKEGLEIKLPVGSNVAFKNNVEIKLDVPAIIIDDRTFVPVRFISESVGAIVNWDKSSRNVIISYSDDSHEVQGNSNYLNHPRLYEALQKFDIDTYEGEIISASESELSSGKEKYKHNAEVTLLKDKGNFEINIEQELESTDETTPHPPKRIRYIAVDSKVYKSTYYTPWEVDSENTVEDLWKEFVRIEDTIEVFSENVDLFKDIEARDHTVGSNTYTEFTIDINKIESKLLYDFMIRNIGIDKSNIKKYYLSIMIDNNNELVKMETYLVVETMENEVETELINSNTLHFIRETINIEEPELDPIYLSDYYNESGYRLHLEGNYEKAIELYEKSVYYNSKNDAAINNIGWALNALGRYEEALPYFDKSIELDPTDAAAPYINKGNALKELKMHDQALLNFNKAIEIDPEMPYSYYGKGQSFYELEKYDEAYENFTEYVKLVPDDVSAYMYLGNIQFLEGEFFDAILFYDKALVLYPYIPEAHIGKARCYIMLNMSAETIESIKKAINIDEEYIDLITSEEIFKDIIDSKEFNELIR